MINPLSVLVATPTIDGKVECNYAGGLMAIAGAHMVGNIVFLANVSDIALARNTIANNFITSDYEWLVFIDSDIGFSPQDFQILMDYPPRNQGPDDKWEKEQDPPGTSVNEHGEALIVCAEYSRKVETGDPVRFGMGFCRIHKSVFETLENAVDDDGNPRVGGYSHQGKVFTNFFPSGPGVHATWFGEDTGFFHLCRLCGIAPRVEQRTRLLHIGRKVYPYVG